MRPTGLTWRILLAAMATGLLPAGSPPRPERVERRRLPAHAEPAALRRPYTLSVVDVPELPPPRVSREARREPGCPVQVKAIVASEDNRLSFAVVATGSKSEVLHPGDGAAVGNSFVAATAIQRGSVTLQRGSATYRCDLTSGSAAEGRAAFRSPSSAAQSSSSISEVTPR